MTPQKTPLSARLNLFWANMLAPINAYLGTALIVLALAMALVGLSGGHMGGGHFGGGYFGWSAGLFGLVLAAGLAAMVGLVAQLIRIEGHLAALRYAMEDSSAAAYAPLALIFYPHPHKKSRAEALLFSSPPLENWMIRNAPNWWPDFWRLAGQIWSNQSLQRPVYIPRLWGCAPK